MPQLSRWFDRPRDVTLIPQSVVAIVVTVLVSPVLDSGSAHAQSSSGWPTVDAANQIFLYPEETTDSDIPLGESSAESSKPIGGPAEPILVYPDEDDRGPDSTFSDAATTLPLASQASAIPIYPQTPISESAAIKTPSDGIPIYPEEPSFRPTGIETTADGIPIYPELDEPIAIQPIPGFSNPLDASLGAAADTHDGNAIVVRSLQLSGAEVLTPEIAQALLQNQLNRPTTLERLDRSALAIDQWYFENGYALSQVAGFIPDSSGVLTVNVVEPRVETIRFRYVDDTGDTRDDQGNVIEGRTREEFLLRELHAEQGDVFNQNDVVRDIRHLMSLGLFDDANVALEVDEDAAIPTVDIIYSLQERLSRSFQASGGVSTELGLFAGANYSDRNVGGEGNALRFGTQIGNRGLVFNTGYTHPYRDSRPNQLGYDVNAFRSSGQSLTFSDEINVANGDEARERQFGGGASVMRPLGEWDAELGLNYTRTSIRDESGDLAPLDELGNALTASDSGIDDLVTLGFAVTQDHRVNPLNPNAGSILSLSTEQSIPVGNGSITMNRLRANYAEFIPISLFNTGRIKNPEVFAFNLQAGTILGNLPPYEAFDLGGSHSVRGYGRGDVGSGRHFMQASAEYRFPVVGPLGAVLFTDIATDLGSGEDVPGDPAGARDKPGTGLGYGFGFRVGSPLGLIRADFGFNDQGNNQFHFGFGQRF